MNRFFVPPESLTSSTVVFPPETAHQIASVLRLRVGQNVILLDNLGSEFEVCLSRVEKKSVSGEVIARRPALPEPAVQVSLYLCLTQREKFEWMLQKCTELGAAAFYPLISSRSLVQDAAEAAKKNTRWSQILQEAAEQSGRGRIPRLYPVQSWNQALHSAPTGHTHCLLAWEEEKAHSLKQALSGLAAPLSLAVLIGPEGGLSPQEASAAEAAGILPVSLGPRILRMETAAITVVANILFELG